MRVARDVWTSIPWESALDVTLAGQYVDVRFLFEVHDRGLQAELRDLRLELLGTEALSDKASLTKDDAVRLVKRYAPKRNVASYRDAGSSEAILDAGVGPTLEYFVEETRSRYAEFPRLRRTYKDLTDLIDGLHELLDELLPSGPVFEKCLRHAVLRNLAPHRVFLHGLFGDALVEQPWHPGSGGDLRWERPKNFGFYLGRLPPARWKDFGKHQRVENLIRVWTCILLEDLGFQARKALEAWNLLDFQDHPVELDPDRITSAAESNYVREKKWLLRRTSLIFEPLADLEFAPDSPDIERLRQLSTEELDYILARLESSYAPPEI